MNAKSNLTPAEYRERVQRAATAFKHLKPSEYELSLIQVVLDNPGSTPGRLSEKLGSSGSTWQMHFGKLCRKYQSLLWLAEPDDRTEPYYGGILVAYGNADGTVTMLPEAAEGFALYGVKASAGSAPSE